MASHADGAVQPSSSLSASGPLQPTTGKQLRLSAASSKPLPPAASSSVMQAAVDDGRRTIAKVPPPDSDDEDEVEIIQAICGRPTRSGRIPRPAVRPAEDTVEQDTGSVAVVKSSASDSTVNVQADVCETASKTLSNPVVSLSQDIQETSATQCSQETSPTQPSDGIQSTSHSDTAVAGTASAVAAAVPPIDLGHLPPGYFVVVEMPSADANSSRHQQALYHVFAVDQGTEASSAVPPVSASSQPSHSSSAGQQRATLSSGNAVRRSVVSSRPLPVSRAGAVMNGNAMQQTSVTYNHSVRTATAAAVPRYTGRDVLTGGQSSSCQDITQICEDLSGLVDCELTATKQEDGTVVIQTMPTARSVPRPPAHTVPRPGRTQLVPRHTSMKLVPRLPSDGFSTRVQQVTPRQPHAAEIFLDANSRKLSDVTGQDDDDSAQYVDIVVEDCDDFEREEYVV